MAGELLLIEYYLQRVKAQLQGGAESVNRAISNRRFIFDLRDINGRPTLATLANQFDANGNKLETATFRYLDETLFESESQLYLRPDNMSDRERIALLCIFHCAAADGIFTPLNQTKRGILQVFQIVVANRIRDVAGFTAPLGYEPNPKMIKIIDAMMQEAEELFEQCQTIAALNAELTKTVPHLSELKHATKEKSLKHTYTVELLAAIGAFARSHDFYKLFNAAQKVKSANKWISCNLNLCVRASPVIDEICGILMFYEPKFLKNEKLLAAIFKTFFAQQDQKKVPEQLKNSNNKLERTIHKSFEQEMKRARLG